MNKIQRKFVVAKAMHLASKTNGSDITATHQALIRRIKAYKRYRSSLSK